MSVLLELDIKLAKLQGFTDVDQCDEFKRDLWGYYEGEGCYQTRWTLDNGEAFKLMAEYNVEVHYSEDWGVSTYIEGNMQGTHCDIVDWANKEEALRVAIVVSVIEKLGATSEAGMTEGNNP